MERHKIPWFQTTNQFPIYWWLLSHYTDDKPSDKHMDTLWKFNIAIENGPFIDCLPIEHCDVQ